MVDLESLHAYGSEAPESILTAARRTRTYSFAESSLSLEEASQAFFFFLAAYGGTAIEFDWVRGQGFCELEDWRYFAWAESVI